MRNFSSDHFTMRTRLLQRPTLCHDHYLRGRRAFPLSIPAAEELITADTKFQTLKDLELVPPKLKLFPRPLWMSPASIRLIDKIATFSRNPHHSQNVARGITRANRRPLVAYSWR